MSLIQLWLRDKAASYTSADRVYADIDAALSRFVALRPKLDVYSTGLFASPVHPLITPRSQFLTMDAPICYSVCTVYYPSIIVIHRTTFPSQSG
jgi:hypothetical protein